jgi:hypothetical protein
MSQDNVVNLDLARRVKKKQLTDRDRLVFAYHELSKQSVEGLQTGLDLLNEVSDTYYKEGLHKDISRALLCWTTYKKTLNFAHGKESEFYIIVSNLVAIITQNKLTFKKSEYFYFLRQELFKDFM